MILTRCIEEFILLALNSIFQAFCIASSSGDSGLHLLARHFRRHLRWLISGEHNDTENNNELYAALFWRGEQRYYGAQNDEEVYRTKRNER